MKSCALAVRRREIPLSRPALPSPQPSPKGRGSGRASPPSGRGLRGGKPLNHPGTIASQSILPEGVLFARFTLFSARFPSPQPSPKGRGSGRASPPSGRGLRGGKPLNHPGTIASLSILPAGVLFARFTLFSAYSSLSPALSQRERERAYFPSLREGTEGRADKSEPASFTIQRPHRTGSGSSVIRHLCS